MGNGDKNEEYFEDRQRYHGKRRNATVEENIYNRRLILFQWTYYFSDYIK